MEGWVALCHLLEEAEGWEREMCVGYVAHHTKGWDAGLRKPLYAWWKRRKSGEVTEYDGLCEEWSGYVWDAGTFAGDTREMPEMPEMSEMPEMRMIWCPSGSFWMGATEAERAESKEYPRHEVTLTRGFWIGQTPVTQAQFVALMGYQPSRFEGARRPVERVSWHEAAAFCNALSRHLGDPLVFVEQPREYAWDVQCRIDKRWVGVAYAQASGFRLPTEAEWEYACRAGSCAPRYAELKRCGWYWNNAARQTQDVAQKQSNTWGLYDTLGNVWEWCYDASGRSYTAESICDPICEGEDLRGGLDEKEVVRVVRGGSWYSGKEMCRAAYRFDDVMFLRDDAIGFRVVRGVVG